MKREAKQVKSLFRTLATICLLTGLAACSASSGGGGEGLGEGVEAGLPGSGTISEEELALNAQRYGDGNIPAAQEGGLFDDIFFPYDSFAVPPQYHAQLRENARVLINDPSIHAEIEGHCDKRGTNEYNLALGQERAKAVAALLISYGVNPKQLSTISYGEEIPLETGDTEAAYAKNRRAHFALSRPGGAAN